MTGTEPPPGRHELPARVRKVDDLATAAHSGHVRLPVRLLEQVNRESASDPGFKNKNLSGGARNLALAHPWPVAELVALSSHQTHTNWLQRHGVKR